MPTRLTLVDLRSINPPGGSTVTRVNNRVDKVVSTYGFAKATSVVTSRDADGKPLGWQTTIEDV